MADNRSFFQINLLPKDSFEFSTLGKFLKWTMSSGRVLVVLTEFVVLLSFGSRFYFDKKLNDLSETIDQKLAQIDTYSEIESQMRTILAKQEPIEGFLNKSINFESKYNTLTSIVPTGVRFEKVFFDQNTLQLNGKADSELGFAQLLQNLKTMDTLTYLNIKDTSFDQSSKSVVFTIQANYK